MTSIAVRGPRTNSQSQVALHLMINQLSVTTMSTALRNESTIINDIPAEMYVGTDRQKLATVLGTLLNTMIANSPNCSIHVSAKSFTNVMLLHLKGEIKMSNPAFTKSLERIQQMAQKIGGTVGITSYRNKITTVALSFVHTGWAA